MDALYVNLCYNNLQVDSVDQSNFKTRADLIHAIKEAKYDIMYLPRNISTLTKHNMKQDFDALSSNQEHQKRFALITQKKKETTTTLRTKLLMLNETEKKTTHADLITILNANNEVEFFSCEYTNNHDKEFEEYVELIKNSQYFNLIKYLVNHGYINEHYSEYINHFYPGPV